MSLNESIVGDAALGWFGELGYAVGHEPAFSPGEPAAERDSFGDVVLVWRLHEAIRRLNPATPEEARATIKRYTNSPKLPDFEQKITKRTKACWCFLNLFVTFVFFCKIPKIHTRHDQLQYKCIGSLVLLKSSI